MLRRVAEAIPALRDTFPGFTIHSRAVVVIVVVVVVVVVTGEE